MQTLMTFSDPSSSISETCALSLIKTHLVHFKLESPSSTGVPVLRVYEIPLEYGVAAIMAQLV